MKAIFLLNNQININKLKISILTYIGKLYSNQIFYSHFNVLF